MATEEERCVEAKRFQRIDEAFRRVDLAALRAAVDNPAVVPNGRMPDRSGRAWSTQSTIVLFRSSAPCWKSAPTRMLSSTTTYHRSSPRWPARAMCQARPDGRTSTTFFGCYCRLARTRIGVELMTTRRPAWPSQCVIRSRSRSFSMAAPILSGARGWV